MPTWNLRSTVVVRGSFHLFRVFVPSDRYLVFRMSNVLFFISTNCIGALFSSAFFIWSAFATDLQIYMHKKFKYRGLHVHGLTSPHNPELHSVESFDWMDKVAIQSKVSDLGSIDDILPIFSYCNHYVLPPFSCLSNLWVIKFWRACSFCFLLRWDTLSGFSHCLLLSTHWGELWYWWLLTCCWPQNLKAIAPSRVLIFSMIYRYFFLKRNPLAMSSVLVFNTFPVFLQRWLLVFLTSIFHFLQSSIRLNYQFCFSCRALSDL